MPKTEPAPNSAPPLFPSEFFSPKSLHTLAGSAGAVWLCCAVISTVVKKGFFEPLQWRLIALVLSEVLTISLLLTARRRTYVAFLLAFLNGLLVFVNASGINAITQGSIFHDADTLQVKKSSLFPFINEVDWWPDPELLAQRDSLRQENERLRMALQQCAAFRMDSSSSTATPLSPSSGIRTPFHRNKPAAHHKAITSKHRKRATDPISLPLSPPVVAGPRGWRAVQPTVATPQYNTVTRAMGSGCTFRITLDSLTATFAGRDTTTMRSVVRFAVEERGLSCHIPPYAVPSRWQKFILADYVLDNQGNVKATYSDISEKPGFYRVTATGQLIDGAFSGQLIVARTPRLNQPAFQKAFALHFQTEH